MQLRDGQVSPEESVLFLVIVLGIECYEIRYLGVNDGGGRALEFCRDGCVEGECLLGCCFFHCPLYDARGVKKGGGRARTKTLVGRFATPSYPHPVIELFTKIRIIPW